MAAAPVHIISKQKVRWHYRGPKDPGALQRVLRESFEERLPAQLSASFDSIAGPDELLHIGRLDIRINADEAHLEPETLSRLIAERLTQALLSTTAEATDKSTKRSGRYEGLRFYLQHGFLPWWAPHDIDLAAALVLLIEESNALGMDQFMRLATQSRAAVRRLLFLLPAGYRAALLQKAFAFSDTAKEALYADLQLIAQRLPFLRSGTSTAQLALLELLLTDFYGKNVVAALSAAVAGLMLENGGAHHAGQALRMIPEMPLRTQGLKQAIIDFVEAKRPEVPRQEQRSNPDPEDLKQIRIAHAGVVLLAPFLPQLFQHLRLQREGEKSLSDIPAAVAALCLLSGLEHPEHEGSLLLPKLLCGIDPDEPVLPLPLLTGDVQTETQLMLQAVISNWPALRNTSAQGLREGFLQREGMLAFAGRNRTLRVQRSAFDILLDQVPWNFRIVRTPWMKDLLYVEW